MSKNSVRTTAKTASKAGKVLNKSKSATTKQLAGSVLVNRKKTSEK